MTMMMMIMIQKYVNRQQRNVNIHEQYANNSQPITDQIRRR